MNWPTRNGRKRKFNCGLLLMPIMRLVVGISGRISFTNFQSFRASEFSSISWDLRSGQITWPIHLSNISLIQVKKLQTQAQQQHHFFRRAFLQPCHAFLIESKHLKNWAIQTNALKYNRWVQSSPPFLTLNF